MYKYATVKANEVDGHMPRGAVIDGEETLSHSATHDKVFFKRMSLHISRINQSMGLAVWIKVLCGL